MAINKNHEFEDLNNFKCAIVEKNASADRVLFLKSLLELNKYQVVVVDSPTPPTFTVGVTDLTFNAINAIFGRALKTADGHIVTLAYWQEKEQVSNDELPYFDNRI